MKSRKTRPARSVSTGKTRPTPAKRPVRLWIVRNPKLACYLGQRATCKDILKARTFLNWQEAYDYATGFLGGAQGLAGWEILGSGVAEHYRAFQKPATAA